VRLRPRTPSPSLSLSFPFALLLTLSLALVSTPGPGTARAAEPYDPVLAAHQLLDSTGAPAAHTPVTIVAVAVDNRFWPSDEPLPEVGSGTTDRNGYVNATLGGGPRTSTAAGPSPSSRAH